ncbi:unnamed protein product [Cladocopium goreaui]|uniref:Zinc finger CCCH domain-containing protein 3 n=1 Tax=Cladocopium goreaui TaxID=2562237 RepID=A0A9P1DJU0_9DINO|nr:unnamed protein product [Cladocopium goreaui]
MHFATDVSKAFESILKAVHDGQEVLLSSYEQDTEKLALYESQLNQQKALYDQLSAEASQQTKDYEEQAQKLQQMTEENQNLNETVRRLNEEVQGLRTQIAQLQLLTTELQDQASQKQEKVPSLALADAPPIEPVEVPQASESSSPTSVTDLPQEEASDPEITHGQEDPPVDVLSSGPYTAHTAPSGARGAPGTAGSTTADTADEVPAVPSAAPALARRSRSRSRPLMRGERLRSMSPGERPERTREVKRTDSRRPLERHTPEERRRVRHVRSEGRDAQRRRDRREAPHSRARLPPPPPVPSMTYGRVDRGHEYPHRINREKVCIDWCMKSCAMGRDCPLRHPPPEDVGGILESFRRKSCHHGKECKRSNCPYRHPGDSRRTPKDRRS